MKYPAKPNPAETTMNQNTLETLLPKPILEIPAMLDVSKNSLETSMLLEFQFISIQEPIAMKSMKNVINNCIEAIITGI